MIYRADPRHYIGSVSLRSLQTKILEAIAKGLSVNDIVYSLCLRVEALAPSAICSLLLVEDGALRSLPAPSLPKSFADSCDGVLIGPTVGSCGTACYRGAAVEVTDIANDPLWDGYRGPALRHGLLACWSSPIRARDGRVVASFALYYRTKRGPSAFERSIVAICIHLCAIILEHAATQAIAHQLACHDQLTGLPNHRRFYELMKNRLVPHSPPFGLLLIDVDHLKIVNDSFGHATGDHMLSAIAQRIAKQAGPSAQACRIGGDEFAVIIDDCADHATLAGAAQAILAAVLPALHCNTATIEPQVTIGGVVAGVDSWEMDVLRQNADFALYHAKDVCRGGYIPFDCSMRSSIATRIDTIRQTATALSEGRIMAHYQPLARLDTGRLIGLEALVRMRLPDGRIATAESFREGFSDPRIASRLTTEMLRQVTTDMRNWLDAGVEFEHVGLNVSPADFRRGDVEARICEAFASAGVPLSHLVLEITESVFMEDPRGEMVRTIASLREKGAIIALDDFGTGFASLTHLITVPVDIIKIDKSFIDRILSHRPSAVVAEALIDIGLKMGLKIVAEGVTSEGQRNRLVELGCILGQGHLFAAASDARTITKKLRENHVVHDALRAITPERTLA